MRISERICLLSNAYHSYWRKMDHANISLLQLTTFELELDFAEHMQ